MRKGSSADEDVNLTELSEEQFDDYRDSRLSKTRGNNTRGASSRPSHRVDSKQLSSFIGLGIPDTAKTVRAIIAKSPQGKKAP